MSILPRTLASLALAVGLTGSVEAATVLRWTAAPDDPSVGMVERISKRLTETSQGRVTIQFQEVDSKTRAAGRERIDSLTAGTEQMTIVTPAPIRGLVPAFGVIEAPYVWRDPAHLLKVMSGPVGQELSSQLVQMHGLRVLGTTYLGTRHVTTKQPVRAVADMRGLRLRVPQNPVFLTMAQAWGAKPMPVALGTVSMALRKNLIDGQEDFLSAIESRKLFEQQKYLVLTGHLLMPRLVLINEKAWQGLGGDDQKALTDAVAEGIAWQNQEVEAQEKKLLDKLKQAGLEIIQPDVESFRKPVAAAMPKAFDAKWGAGLYQRIVDTK